MREACAELVAPAANRFVADIHATLEQQLPDVAQAQLEPEVAAYRVTHDRSREAMTVIKRFRFLHRPI
jgi:hypothetical protein